MNNTADEFVKHLLRSLCQKFSLNGKETPVLDTFCNELMELSRHFQDYILTDIFKMPASLITLEELFLEFLNSVCSEICELEETVERKFYILCAFLTIVTTVSFTLPCYRLITNIKMVLTFKLKSKFALNYDLEDGFKELEGHCLLLTKERLWIRSRLHRLRRFIEQALEKSCSRLEKQPDVASYLKEVNESRSSKPEGEPLCPFCKLNCKAFLETLLNG